MSAAIEPRHGAPGALLAIAAEHARSRRRRRLRGLGKHAFLIVVTFLLVAPFYYVVLASFKNSTEIFTYPPKLLPIPPFIGNYQKLLGDTGFLRWMFNTLFVASTVTLIKVFMDSMAGYALAKLQLTGKRAIFLAMLILLMVPLGALIVPLWALVNAMGLTNTYFALILPPLANPLGVFLMRQFILGLPKDLENAGRLDGLSEFGIYRRIILPLIKPGLVVLAVIIFTDQFMSFIWPLIADLQRRSAGVDRGRGGAPLARWRRLRPVVRGGGDVAGPDRDLLLRPAAPVPGQVPSRSIETMTQRGADAQTPPRAASTRSRSSA